MKPQQVLISSLAQAPMLHGFNHVILPAIQVLSNVFKSWYSLLNIHIFFIQYGILPLEKLCFMFSLGVAHSRFSILLSLLILFLWFTKGLFSGFGIYVRATNLGADKYILLFSQSGKQYLQYHLKLTGFKNNHFPVVFFGGLQTLPSSVTAYLPSYHGMSRILTKLKNRYILKSGKNKMHLSFTQKCIQDFFDRNSILLIA